MSDEPDFVSSKEIAEQIARKQKKHQSSNKQQPNGVAPKWHEPDDTTLRKKLSLDNWLSRDTATPDFLLGQLLSTTSRMLLVGPTGLGKTNLGLAIAYAIADGAPFLHWRAGEGPGRVLYVDGEMPERLMRSRLEDGMRRLGAKPDSLFILSREDFPDMPPLNTEPGQQFINRAINAVGGIDLAFFDNIQALLAGDMKDEEPWQQTLSWVRDLTRRKVGQAWVHHTGHDESHSYGTKTREWQLDTVALLERLERPECDIAFRLSFLKARERSPDNRSDFEPAVITLADDQWTSERGGQVRGRRNAKDRALELLKEAISCEGTIPPACSHIPPQTLAVTEGLWRRYCKAGFILESDNESTFRSAFHRASKRLLEIEQIGKWDLWVWIVK